ncbi:MAG: DUF29 domain-containing protein [Alphaproteobacteria bacterium]|nr:DUF29 domain-containing protein [Alphaproteobacteria bacterium]
MSEAPAVQYEDDFFAWTQDQAEALRRLAARRPNDLAELDLPHIAEELADMGLAELRAVESHLGRVLFHLLKAASSRNPEVVGHWRAEAVGFHDEALARLTPALTRRIDLDRVWRRAKRQAEAALRDYNEALAAPGTCPFTLAELLRDDLDIDAAVERLKTAR